jgi:hypothetical protein
MWLHLKPGESFPFVYFVREDDTATITAMEGLKALWARKYPTEEFPLFTSNATEAEILEAVDDVITDWNQTHPGEPYPRSIIAASEHGSSSHLRTLCGHGRVGPSGENRRKPPVSGPRHG